MTDNRSKTFWFWLDPDIMIPVVIGVVLASIVGGFAYDSSVNQPKRREAYAADLREKKADCVRRGGKVTEYNGGSVWSVDWACDGATKF